MFKIDPIFKYRFMWFAGVVGLLGTLAYTVYSGDWMYWLASYIYFRCLWFFTNNIGLHRYFAHRGYKTGPKRHKFLAWITVLAGVGSPFTWTIHHRHHHQYSDVFDENGYTKDIHSPNENKWASIFGTWAIQPLEWWTVEKQVRTVPKDLVKDPTVMFIHKWYYPMWSAIFVGSWLLVDWQFTLFFVLQPIGWNLVHGALINYFNHTKWPGSYRNYDSNDTTWNNVYIHMFLLGEGLHNNHHAQGWNYNQAHKPGEFDPAAWVIDHFFKVEDDRPGTKARS